MTFTLTETGYGLAFHSEPLRIGEKVLFTFKSKNVDYALIGEKFFPIKDGRLEVPLSEIPELFAITAYAKDGRRYLCDTLARVEGEEPDSLYLAPLNDCEGRLLIALTERIERLEARLGEMQNTLASHEDAIHQPPITFGGAYETN